MKLYKFSLALLSVLTLGLMTSCDDDDVKVAKAVLVSAPTVVFDGTGADPQTVTVYSDAQWVADVPEWVTITPDTGSGTTDVTITVSDNLRDGSLDNPRKGMLVFRGNTKASRYEVVVRQLGDNYRDCPIYKTADINTIDDEAYVGFSNLIVTLPINGGFVATDDNGANNIVVKTAETVAKGDVVSINAQKFTDERKLAFVNAEKLNVVRQGEAVVYPTATDITETLDKYTSNKREYVKVEGILASGIVTVGESKLKVATVDNVSVNLDALNGHIVGMYGYFAGIAEPYLNIQPTELEDLGEAQTIYWSEDFEWLAPWAEIGNGNPCGDSVGEDNPDATSPQIVTPVIDGVSALQALMDKGYDFLRVTTKTAGECIYLNKNYLKFGKTSYQAGIILPSMEAIPADYSNLQLAFDWCPMRQGSGKIDPVNLIVIVEIDGAETTIEVPTHGWANDHKLEWIHTVVDLSAFKVDKNTKITIRQTEWPAATANRWFLDNLSIYSKL